MGSSPVWGGLYPRLCGVAFTPWPPKTLCGEEGRGGEGVGSGLGRAQGLGLGWPSHTPRW